MRLLISEVLQKVSNAKTKAEKINLLRQHNTQALRSLLIWNFDDSIINAIPPGTPPYRPNEAPPGTEHTTLEHESRLFYHFLKGGNDNLGQTRREQMFIQMLEGLQASEAEVLLAVKDKQLHKKYKITFATVKEAFPEITWGGRGA
jgi:hypothetical protein